MPELADVEGFRGVLAEHAGRRIVEVQVRDPGVLRGTSGPALRAALRGRRLGQPWRHGKWLIAPTDGPTLAMHFGMTGALLADGPEHRHDRVVFVLDGTTLRYRDMRKLTGMHLARERSDLDALLAELGPDAAAVSRSEFTERLAQRGRQLKPALMDQRVIAGLGNLLVDEILWRARLHPARNTAKLDRAALATLHARMRSVLRTAATAGKVPARRSSLTGHRDETGGDDGRCPRCDTRLRYGRVGARSTVWCPRCQPAP